MARDRISDETPVSTHTWLFLVPQLSRPATARQQTCLMLFLAPELHVSVQKPLNANWGDCSWLVSLNNSLWGGVHRLSFYVCVYVWRWDMLSGKPVRTSTWPLQPVLWCVFVVIGSHHSAFSRWFLTGLCVTCDNITVLKGQAWREPVGRLGCPQSAQYSPVHTHYCVVPFKRKGLSWIFKHTLLNTLLLTRQCKYLLYYLNLRGPSRSCREGAAIFACW